jgi:hypothetical protein
MPFTLRSRRSECQLGKRCMSLLRFIWNKYVLWTKCVVFRMSQQRVHRAAIVVFQELILQFLISTLFCNRTVSLIKVLSNCTNIWWVYISRIHKSPDKGNVSFSHLIKQRVGHIYWYFSNVYLIHTHIQSVLSDLAVIKEVRSRVHCDKYCRVCTIYVRKLYLQCDIPSPSHNAAATIPPLLFCQSSPRFSCATQRPGRKVRPVYEWSVTLNIEQTRCLRRIVML